MTNNAFDLARSAIDERIAKSIKTSTHYQHYHDNYDKWLRLKEYGSIQDITEQSNKNIMLYMHHINEKAIQRGSEREGVGSIKQFVSAMKYYYSNVHPTKTKEIWNVSTMQGSPARSHEVESLLKSYHNGVVHVTPKRSHAITIQQVGAVIGWIENDSRT